MNKAVTVSAAALLGLIGAFSLNGISQVSVGVEGPGVVGGGGGGLETACVPAGDEFDILLDDGAGGCTSLGAGMADEVLTSAGAGMSPTWAAASGASWTYGTFEATWETACSTTPSQTINYATDGVVVILQPIDNISCTGDSTNFLATDVVPMAIRPAARRVGGSVMETFDNSVATGGCLLIESNGNLQLIDVGTTINWCTDSSTTNWQASGNRSWSGLTGGGITYLIQTTSP